MDINTAKGLVKNYQENQWAYINQQFAADNIKDARCVWFSLQALKAFIAEIEQGNARDVVTTGVRIYFGAYSEDVPGPATNYDRLHTLLMLPTFTGADGKNYDFNSATGTSDFATMSSITALNHGTLCPPPYNATGPDNMYQQGTLFMAYADGVTTATHTE